MKNKISNIIMVIIINDNIKKINFLSKTTFKINCYRLFRGVKTL